MALKMFRSTTPIKTLTSTIEENLDIYRSGSFDGFLVEQQYITLNEEFQDKDLDALICSAGPTNDVENSLLIWEKVKISPRVAREARLWVVLSHGVGLEYVRARWPLDSENHSVNVGKIKNKFLVVDDKRGIDRENAISRLWMSSYVASKVSSLPLEQALSVLLNQTDFREGLIGRPTVLKSVRTLNAVMSTAKRILIDENDPAFFARKKNKGQYRSWLEEINLEGGTKLLDGLSDTQLTKLVNDLADAERR